MIYAVVFFTGDKKPNPKLGLDLQGGTSMTLSATQPDGSAPKDPKSLEQARDIIADRVDLTGVAEPEVVIEGDRNIVVNVAGGMSEDELRKLVAPAVLRFRKVLKSATDTAVPAEEPSESASAEPSASVDPSASTASEPAASEPASTDPSASEPASADPSDSVDPSASASASEAPIDAGTEAQREAVITKLGELYSLAQQLPDPDDSQPLDEQYVAMLAPFGQLTAEEVAVLPADIQFRVPTISCKQLTERPAGAVADSEQKVVACETRGGDSTKHFLDVAKVVGEDVSGASFSNDPAEGGWKVDLSFKSGGQDKWTALTKEAYNDGAEEQVAIVLDNRVVSAPQIKGVISGDAQITGSFDKKEVETLSRQLKYGSLPLSFEVESVDSVTATIGEQAMYMGLLAGAIGLVLVIIYCLLYYRALGFVVILSLLVSGAMVYGMLVLFGRQLGFSLTLAGIAGFIVAIGITADSFVVFFERLKDEVKDGRTVRSAVPRAWVRARRTIISADTVSILAALVLYLLAVGPVKGFAFTLGMSTVLDLIVVFLFTHPLVALLSRANAFSSPRFSGLGNVRSDRDIATARSSRLRTLRTKES
ncbi:MAG: protein translocase subunit SecD [Dactylosporangium sp.]|nr:protein translocase subunit SecD [Dactylosporangium sp.]NNJ60469.1 protein translocase subunit SecD [Dactylosporangium sp.]